jgi:hypothetical protein
MPSVHRSSLTGAALTAALWLCGSAAPPARVMTPRELLRSVAQFTDAEWAMVERGEAVAKILDTDTREVAVAGGVRIQGPRDELVSRSRDLDVLRRSTAVLDVGRFSAPPAAADLQAVTFDDHNLDLRNCRPGDCRVRLSAGDIARFHKEVNWNGAAWREESARVWRDVLARYAAGYLLHGRKALPDYVNKPEALSVASEVSLLTSAYGFVSAYSPELTAYLRDFGANPPAGAQQLLYWTREDFGIRPIVRISHQVVLQGSLAPSTLIATNQVYADHYMDAALTVTVAVEAPGDAQPNAAGAPAFYMISVSRARTRSLSGLLRRMARSTVQSRSRETMRKILGSAKAAIEKHVPTGR